MKTITNDTVDFLPIDCLQKLVFAAIDEQAGCDNPDDPQRAAQHELPGGSAQYVARILAALWRW